MFNIYVKPEIGQTWKTRDNRESYTIINTTDSTLMAIDSKKRMVIFNRDGSFSDPKFPHKNDLVSIV
jgi:hypothetical protein